MKKIKPTDEFIKIKRRLNKTINLRGIKQPIIHKKGEFFIKNQWLLTLRESIYCYELNYCFSSLAASRMALEMLLLEILYDKGYSLRDIKEKIGKGKGYFFELGRLIEFCLGKIFNNNDKEYEICNNIKKIGNLYIHLKPDDIVNFHKLDTKIKDKIIEKKIPNQDKKEAIYKGLSFKFFIPWDALENLKNFVELIDSFKKKGILN